MRPRPVRSIRRLPIALATALALTAGLAGPISADSVQFTATVTFLKGGVEVAQFSETDDAEPLVQTIDVYGLSRAEFNRLNRLCGTTAPIVTILENDDDNAASIECARGGGGGWSVRVSGALNSLARGTFVYTIQVHEGPAPS